MGTIDFGAVIAGVVRQWGGVEVTPHRFGGVEFRVGGREIGHVHVGGVADLLVPVRLRRDLVAAGRAMAHHTLPHSGWISVRLRSEHDVPNAIALFRLNYERLTGVVVKKAPTSQILPNVTLLADRSIDDLPA
jgi:hypothetical protein